MVHKKYIKRGNKTFGPYLYENYREDGKTKTRYLGCGEKKDKKKTPIKMRVNKNLFIIFFLVLVLLFIGSSFLVSKNVIKSIDVIGELTSQKGFLDNKGFTRGIMDLLMFESTDYFSVTVNIIENSPPKILNLDSELIVCENQILTNQNFTAQDDEGDDLEFYINPTNLLYWLKPLSSSNEDSLLGVNVNITTWRPLNKGDVIIKRVFEKAYALYEEEITVSDGFVVANKKVNITVIEVNNLEAENIGVQTVWTKGDNTNFYKKWAITDLELGDLNYNISFSNEYLFDIVDGEMNFTANESYLLPGQESVVHDITVCVNDSGLEYESHPLISNCKNYNFDEKPKYICEDFSLTITNENRPPVILSTFPDNFTFSGPGNSVYNFNVSVHDPDGTIPDIYWSVDSIQKKYTSNSSFDSFGHLFGCEVGGRHKVKLVVTDGELNDSLEWDLDIGYISCSRDSGGEGSSGGGGLRLFFCEEDWVCGEWAQCSNLKDSFLNKEVTDYYNRLISERCDSLNYKEDICGFQVRDCIDVNRCNTNKTILPTLKECYYTINPNCSDGIKNCHDGSCEVLTDCGGPCESCATCFDGVQNQNEEEVDCGGPCEACVEVAYVPLFLKLVISYSLVLLLILVFTLIIYQIRKYYLFSNKVKEKKINEKYESKKVNEKNKIKKINEKNEVKKIAGFLLVLFLVLLLVVNLYFADLAYSDQISLTQPGGGVLGSTSLFNGFLRSFADVFLIKTITYIVDNNGDSSISVWDDTDDDSIDKFSLCEDSYCGQKEKGDSSYWTVSFYANYTNLGVPINDLEGNCDIWFEDKGWENMVYDLTSGKWNYTRYFDNRGIIVYNISCTSALYNDFPIETDVEITNTVPYITKTADGNVRGLMSCIEDIACTYDFSKNVSEDDDNDLDNLEYNYLESSNTTLTNFTLNSETGILEVNVVHSNYTGEKIIELTASDGEGPTSTAILTVDIQDVNDPPFFTNLINKSYNMSEDIEYIVYSQDEEDNSPFIINISFISCDVAPWSTRLISGDCELFNESEYEFNKTSGVLNMSFRTVKDDVGVYYINFSLMDNDSLLGNASTSVIINFTVLVVNEAPIFRYVCDNERRATEDTKFTCWINATDTEELNNLTFSSDKPWFLNNKSSDCSELTNYNSSVNASFTARDSEVGNWSINILVTDTGKPERFNSTIIEFFVENVNDPVILDPIADDTYYPFSSTHLPIRARDDDLLIPVSGLGVYQEDLTFEVKFETGGSVPWISIEDTGEGSLNKSVVYLNFEPTFDEVGIHSINLSVYDFNSFSIDSQIFEIKIDGNTPPAWLTPLQTDFIIFEDDTFNLDLSSNATDADPGDSVSFSDDNGNPIFPSFSLDSNGLINFIPIDLDVGQHIVEIVADDVKTFTPMDFNFTVYNVNDAPNITTVLGKNVSSTLDLVDAWVSADEDDIVKFSLFVEDEDFNILQKSFYDEMLYVNLTIDGPNTNLFDFEIEQFSGDIILYNATFIPGKLDVDDYEISVNISDNSGLSDTIKFNLTILFVEHSPVLMNFTNYSAELNYPFYLDIEATDLEDINDSTGLMNYSYEFLSGGDFINHDENIFNTTTGELNYTFSSVGNYQINITVTDSNNFIDSGVFWIFVYDAPIITKPVIPCQYDLKENVISNIIFSAMHNVGDDLTFRFILGNETRDELLHIGDNTDLNWSFAPNFHDETYGSFNNLTLIVLNPNFPRLNSSITCKVNISHTNAPVQFNKFIGDKSASFGSIIGINLSDHFSDIDYYDPFYNQSLSFLVKSYTTPSSIFTNFDPNLLILSFSSSVAVKEFFNITGVDSDGLNVTSNNFSIEFVDPNKIKVPKKENKGSSSSGSQGKIISLKIITPGRISSYAYEKIDIPLSLFNTGQANFKELSLSASAYKDGDIAHEVEVSLDKSYLESLVPGQKENFTLSVFFSSDKVGDYEILVNLSSVFPYYTDWAKIHISLQRINESKVRDVIVFTEEFIARNPQCIEIKELLEEAKEVFDDGDFSLAQTKAEEAMNACENSIKQVSIPRIPKTPSYTTTLYFLIALISAVILGILYYFFQRWRISKRSVLNTESKVNNKEGKGLNKSLQEKV